MYDSLMMGESVPVIRPYDFFYSNKPDELGWVSILVPGIYNET